MRVNQSTITNFLANRGFKLYVPKWLFRFFWNKECDLCGGTNLPPAAFTVERKWFKHSYRSEAMMCNVYAHANYEDCKVAKEIMKEMDKIKEECKHSILEDAHKECYAKYQIIREKYGCV